MASAQLSATAAERDAATRKLEAVERDLTARTATLDAGGTGVATTESQTSAVVTTSSTATAEAEPTLSSAEEMAIIAQVGNEIRAGLQDMASTIAQLQVRGTVCEMMWAPCGRFCVRLTRVVCA